LTRPGERYLTTVLRNQEAKKATNAGAIKLAISSQPGNYKTAQGERRRAEKSPLVLTRYNLRERCFDSFPE
jgi:hypothetical protein